MRKRIKQLIIFALVVGLTYGLLSQHFFFYGRQFKILPKEELTFNNTFVNVEPTELRTPLKILRDDTLREIGVGDVMVEFEIITSQELEDLEQRIDG